MHVCYFRVAPGRDQMSSGVQLETYILLRMHVYLFSLIKT
jgi:hypothetical protein